MTITTLAEYPTNVSNVKAGIPRRTVEFRQLGVEMAMGNIRRTEFWRYPRYKFEIGYEVTDDAYAFDIEGFYNGVKGAAESFLFQDWHRPNPQNELLAAGDGSRRIFKIWGDYFDGLVVKVSGVTAAVSAYSPSTGYVMLTSAPASGALVTANVRNEKYRVIFDQEPVPFEYLGGDARRFGVTLIQPKEQLEDAATIPWTQGTPPP